MAVISPQLRLLLFLLVSKSLFTSLEFFTLVLAGGLSLEFEWQQVFRTLLSILADLSDVVIWIVSTRPPTFKSSRPFNNPLVIVPKAPITIGTIVTFMFHSFFNSLARSRYLSFLLHSSSFILWSAGTAKSTILQILFFCWLLLGLVFCPRLGDPCVCQSPIGVYVCHLLGQVLGCAYTICWCGQISISFTFPRGLPCRSSRVSSYIPSVLICCIRLLCDWSFHLCHHIACTCYFVESYLFWLWYDWFLWRCPVLLLGEIPFLS